MEKLNLEQQKNVVEKKPVVEAKEKLEKPKKIDTNPDNLIYDEKVVAFQKEVRSFISQKGKDFFDLYSKVTAEIQNTMPKKDLDKSPYYHALIGSSGSGETPLEFVNEVDDKVVEIFKKHFNSE